MSDLDDDSGREGPSDTAKSGQSRGADLARQALAAARERNAAARRRPRRGSGAGAASPDGSADPNSTGASSTRDPGSLRLRRRRWSGPGPDPARDPQRFADTAATWISRSAAGGDIAKARLFAKWADIVGPAVADHCTPATLVDRELVLNAESTAWATQLRLMAPTLITRINAEIGAGTVTRIRTKGPSGPSWRFGNRHVSGRGPRDTYG